MELVNPADLIDAAGVADVLGLASRKAVSVYRARYDDFPQPRVERGDRIALWLRQDIERWKETRGGQS